MPVLLGFEHVNMVVSDLDKTLHFYVDLVGFRLKVRKQTGNGGEVAFVETRGAQLEIFCPKDKPKTPARLVPRDEAGVGHIALTVDDVEATYKRLSAAGVEFTEKPRLAINKEILYQVSFCKDPDGMLVEFGSPSRE
jgi:glyoxylase I family protein